MGELKPTAQEETSQALAPMVERYFARQVHPAYIDALGATKQVLDQLNEHGYDHKRIKRQLTETSERLEVSQGQLSDSLTFGANFTGPAQRSIDQVAATVARYGQPGQEAAAKLRRLRDLINPKVAEKEMLG